MAWYDLSASNQAAQNAIENRSRQQELFDQRAQYISNAFQQGGAGLQTLANTHNDIKQQKDADELTNYLKNALSIKPTKATKDNAGVSPLESFANKTPQGNTTQDPNFVNTLGIQQGTPVSDILSYQYEKLDDPSEFTKDLITPAWQKQMDKESPVEPHIRNAIRNAQANKNNLSNYLMNGLQTSSKDEVYNNIKNNMFKSGVF